MMDVTEFPSTPQEMHLMLSLEEVAKRQGKMDHLGISGVVYLPSVRAYEVPLSMRNSMKLGPDGEVLLGIRDMHTG